MSVDAVLRALCMLLAFAGAIAWGALSVAGWRDGDRIGAFLAASIAAFAGLGALAVGLFA
jgi:hypothetical protein